MIEKVKQLRIPSHDRGNKKDDHTRADTSRKIDASRRKGAVNVPGKEIFGDVYGNSHNNGRNNNFK
jgi:hypothetical protein